MDKNRLWIAAIVLLALGGAVVSATRSREAETEVVRPTASLPALKSEDITSLEVYSKRRGSVTLSKQGESWQVTAPVSAKADASAVEAMLEKLSTLEVKSIAASRKENYARLEVDDEQAVRVKVGKGDQLLSTLFLGAAKATGTMLRVEGKDEVFNVKGSLRYAFDKDLKNFRDRVILDVDSEKLSGLKLSSAKGTFNFEKVEGKWTQVLSKGEKPIARFAPAKVQSLSSTLGRLQASDFVEATESPETLGLAPPAATAVLTQVDGSSHTLQLGQGSGANNESALRLVGNEVLFRISKYNADKLLADAAAFQEAEQKPEAQAPQMPDMGGGNGEIPPEVLRQLQQQLGQGGFKVQ